MDDNEQDIIRQMAEAKDRLGAELAELQERLDAARERKRMDAEQERDAARQALARVLEQHKSCLTLDDVLAAADAAYPKAERTRRARRLQPEERGALGVAIRAGRLKSRLSMLEFAARIGVSASAVAAWEQGRSRPSEEFRPKLAKLGVDLSSLNDSAAAR